MTYNVCDVLQVGRRRLRCLRVARHPLKCHTLELYVAIALHRPDVDVDPHATIVPDVSILCSITYKQAFWLTSALN